jgi:hypothetical protein
MALRGVRLGMPKRCPGVRALSVKRQYRTQGMKANPLLAEAAGQAHTPCPSFQVPGTPPGHMGLKHRLPVHVGRQGIQGLIDERAAQLFFFFGPQFRIAQRVRDGHCGHDAVGPDAQRNGNDGTHMHDRDISRIFDALGERCTATRARASGGGEDNPVHMRGLEPGAYFRAELAGIGYGRAVADGTVEHMVELADFAFLFQIAQHVDGQDAVRVRIGSKNAASHTAQ